MTRELTREQAYDAERCIPFYGECYEEENEQHDEEAWIYIREHGIPEDDELPF